MAQDADTGRSDGNSSTGYTFDPIPAKQATLYILNPLHPASERYAEEKFKKVVRTGVEGWTRERCLAECDGMVLRVGKMPAGDIAIAPRLRIIARNGTGYDTIDLDKCKERGVVVTNLPGGNAAAVAELAIALALAVLRRVVELNNRIRAGECVPSITALAPGLMGKTVGLVGMGDIAYEAAKLFRAFGCPVVVYSPTSPPRRWIDPTLESGRYPVPVEHTRVNTLDELLATVDVVSLHCPLTPETRGMLSTREFSIMKPGAVLLNTSRGSLVDQDALADALKNGQLLGAGLDVMAVEPAFGENIGALRDLRNVVILPHVGASTDQVQEIGCTAAIDTVIDYLEGRGARNRVA